MKTITRKDLNEKICAIRALLNAEHTETNHTARMHAFDLIKEEYHHRDNILDALEYLTSDYGKSEDIITDIDSANLSENLMEVCDSQTPVYNGDAIQWMAQGTNWCAVDEYVDETGAQDYTNIMNLVTAAYAYTLENEARATLEAILADTLEA